MIKKIQIVLLILFSEPVYLNGNIKEGNGVFAICRSSVLSIKFSPLF